MLLIAKRIGNDPLKRGVLELVDVVSKKKQTLSTVSISIKKTPRQRQKLRQQPRRQVRRRQVRSHKKTKKKQILIHFSAKSSEPKEIDQFFFAKLKDDH